MIGLALPSLQTWIIVLAVSLIVTLLAIGYQQLIRRLSKDRITLEKYCVLHSLETEVAEGDVDFYFTTEESRKVTFEIMNENYETLEVIYDQECQKGGNIIPFDTRKLPNGEYFYCLKTYNQKTMKKMKVQNVA